MRMRDELRELGGQIGSEEWLDGWDWIEQAAIQRLKGSQQHDDVLADCRAVITEQWWARAAHRAFLGPGFPDIKPGGFAPPVPLEIETEMAKLEQEENSNG